MIGSIKEWGLCRGIYLGTKRIMRCRPKGPSGEDFIPLNVKGELKWVY
jgi:putative component of membrane protein insertase Oxa1/YidC/SpoIIIJ protein YidD